MAETDNPWKEGLDELCPYALAFFLPEAAERVDWTRDPESLETELRPFLPWSQTGLKYVDKLIKVWRKPAREDGLAPAGAEEEEYYHFEFHYRKEQDFEKRVSDYNDVGRVHLRHHIVSTAILGDEDPDWMPSVYHWKKDGCELTFKFNTIKLLKWRGKEQALLDHDNPFALFVLAHLLILPTAKDDEARADWKLRLWQRACKHKMEDQDRNTLLRLIDWMLLLPKERNMPLLQQFNDWREDNPMPFVSVFEEAILDQKQAILEQKQAILEQKQLLLTKDQQILDQKQQLRENCLAGIAVGLKLKFKEAGQALFADVEKQADLDWLRRFLQSIEPADSLDDLRKLLP